MLAGGTEATPLYETLATVVRMLDGAEGLKTMPTVFVLEHGSAWKYR
jgi:hypothetical protein